MQGALQGDAAEVLRDLTEITHVDVDPDDDEEPNEQAYTELVEFVRVGVQLLYDHLQPLRETPPPRPAGNAALKTATLNPARKSGFRYAARARARSHAALASSRAAVARWRD